MSTTMVANEAKAVPTVVSSIQDIPMEKIRESKTNPRSQFDQAKLAELADFVPGNRTGVMFRLRFCAPGVGNYHQSSRCARSGSLSLCDKPT